MTVIDLLDALDLDIRGFDGALSDASILFYVDEYQYASTSAAFPEEIFHSDDLMKPRKWLAASPPPWNNLATHIPPPCESLPGLAGRVLLASPSRLSAKENVPSPSPSPTERSFSRLRHLSSSFTLKALNSTFSSPDCPRRVLI